MKRSRRKVIQALTSSHGGKSGRQAFCKCNQEFMCTGSSQTRTSPSQEEKKSDSVCNSQTCKSSMLRSKNAFCKRVTGKQHVTERLQTPWPFWNKPLPCLVILVFLPPAPLVQSTGSLCRAGQVLFSLREKIGLDESFASAVHQCQSRIYAYGQQWNWMRTSPSQKEW